MTRIALHDSTSTATASMPLGLRARALRGSTWAVAGFAFNQCFRLASNIVLAYLLFPRAFGLMALVRIFLDGLQMFSDVGIGPSIIQKKQGADPTYINTAWTVQIIRGLALWVVACAIAWPVSRFWDPQLLYLLPVAGVTAAIAGFNSTHLFTLNRSLTLKPITLLNMATQVVSVMVMIVWAVIHPSVWALLGGRIAGSVLTMAASHRLTPGAGNRLAWDRQARRELFTFGRWVFISTVITFLAMQIDKLMLGKLLSTERLGVFWIALSIAQLGPAFMKKLAGTVGFPVLAELYRRDLARFRHRLQHVRLALILPVNVGLLVMIALGPWAVRLIYPDRYADAGWMLTALAAGSLAGMVNSTYGNALLAMGGTLSVMTGVAGQLCIMVPATLVGYHLAGERGFVLGIASVQWLLYPVYMTLAIRAGVWQPMLDLPILLGFGGAAGVLMIA